MPDIFDFDAQDELEFDFQITNTYSTHYSSAYDGLAPGGEQTETEQNHHHHHHHHDESLNDDESEDPELYRDDRFETPRHRIRRLPFPGDHSAESEDEHSAGIAWGCFEPDSSPPVRRGNFAALYLRGPEGQSPTESGFEWPNTGTPDLDSRALFADDDDDLFFAQLPLPSSYQAFVDFEEEKVLCSERSPEPQPDLFDAVLGPPGEGYVYEYSLNKIPDGIKSVQYSFRRYLCEEHDEDEDEWRAPAGYIEGLPYWIIGVDGWAEMDDLRIE